MANLSAALSQALSGLRTSSAQSALVARNIARASEEGYSRKYAGLTTDIDGTARISSVNRYVETALSQAFNGALSSSEGQKELLASLENLRQTVGDITDGGSLAAGINDLQNKLRLFEASPSDETAGASVMSSASNLAKALNSASNTVQMVRADADSGMKATVESINALLAQFEDVNTRITKTPPGEEGFAEALDSRDKILKNLSSELGVRTTLQPNNGLAIYTDGGVTLFNLIPRTVTFQPASGFSAATVGNAVYADGVAITGPSVQMASTKGKLAAFADVRDTVAVTYQNQLDEIARGLVSAFSETDQSAVPTRPDATGLYSYAGSPTVPSDLLRIPGLASSIRVSANFDPAQGGNPMLLRDGGANGAGYVVNTTNASGFQQRLTSLIEKLDNPSAFAPGTGLQTSASIKTYAASSAGWLEARRAEAARRSDYLGAIAVRSKEALSRSSGVNLDDEMSTMLNLERSYQASAKVVSIVDQMFSHLMEAVK
jgi:flagellar hook-associated protein 1